MKFTKLLLIILIMCFGLNGCTYKDKPLEYGFRGPRGEAYHSLNYILCGVKSPKMSYYLEDVEMDFYYGWNLRDYEITEVFNRVEYVHSVALYFYDWSITNKYCSKDNDQLYISLDLRSRSIERGCMYYESGSFTDYKNINGMYFIKEYDPYVFFTTQFQAYYNRVGFFGQRSFTAYNFHETLTIPLDLFLNYNGSICFGLAIVYYISELNEYLFLSTEFAFEDGDTLIQYSINNNITITKLTEARDIFYIYNTYH